MTTHARTRLTPEARKNHLLATAKQVIIDRGLAGFTMEALARAAHVSNPLVYNYFSSRKELLEVLLQREYRNYTQALIDDTLAAKSFNDMARVFIASNFDQYDPENILPALLNQADIAQCVEVEEAIHGQQIANHVVSYVKKKFKLTTEQAKLLAYMSSGACKAAADYYTINNINREKTIDTALIYIKAGMSMFAPTPHSTTHAVNDNP